MASLLIQKKPLFGRLHSCLKDYDKSDSVNSFIINGKSAWLDKATRVGLINSLNMEKVAGREMSVLYLNGEKIDISVDDALQLLVVLELYAKECYVVTEQHIANVRKMNDIGRIHNYRFDVGYPEKPKFVI